MATINKDTRLFENLTDTEVKELEAWAEAALLEGKRLVMNL